jgi:hypothetical protein
MGVILNALRTHYRASEKTIYGVHMTGYFTIIFFIIIDQIMIRNNPLKTLYKSYTYGILVSSNVKTSIESATY